jgi:hypothetical protein
MKTILVTLVLFHLEVGKTVKVFDTRKWNMQKGLSQKALMMILGSLEREEPPLRGYRLFYTCAPEQIRRSQLELCETLA